MTSRKFPVTWSETHGTQGGLMNTGANAYSTPGELINTGAGAHGTPDGLMNMVDWMG